LYCKTKRKRERKRERLLCVSRQCVCVAFSFIGRILREPKRARRDRSFPIVKRDKSVSDYTATTTAAAHTDPYIAGSGNSISVSSRVNKRNRHGKLPENQNGKFFYFLSTTFL
jgi:hypothetical protein